MLDRRAGMLDIVTPEGVVFGLPLAGPAARFLAWLIDLAVIMVIVWAVEAVAVFGLLLAPDLTGAFFYVAYFTITIGYGIALEWLWRGQTLGKRLLKLRVVDERGLRLHFSQVLLRNLLRFVDALPLLYLAGGAACVLSRKRQRLGDYAANTVVIQHSDQTLGDAGQLDAGKYNSFREYPHIEARLRHATAPEEAAAALEAVLRRDAFDPVERVELFRDVAAHFRAKAAFPEEATAGLTDERYVRNVVDSLFRAGRPAGE